MNLVLFIIDDLNDWVNYLNPKLGIKTPNLDKLSRIGITFTEAHTPAPVCNCARCSIQLSLDPRHSIKSNGHDWRIEFKNRTTLPRHYKQNGYKVYGAGKIFHGDFYFEDDFTEYFPRPDTDTPPEKEAGGIPYGPNRNRTQDMSDYAVVRWALNKLTQAKGNCLTMIGVSKPHTPWAVPKEWFDLYPLSQIELPISQRDALADLSDLSEAAKVFIMEDKPINVVSETQQRELIQAYRACISFADSALGLVLDSIDLNNTYLVVHSDNGMHMGQKYHIYKKTLWNEATKVPFIVAGPGIKPGKVKTPISLLNLFPTLLDLIPTENPPTNKLDGISLAPLIKNPTIKWGIPAISAYKGAISLRRKNYKFILYPDGSKELYDLKLDRECLTNLAGLAEYQSRIKRFTEICRQSS